jgi:DNA mismatch endonuclease (patch repair protein)
MHGSKAENIYHGQSTEFKTLIQENQKRHNTLFNEVICLVDVHSKKVRSYNMSRIKSKNTKPEEIVRKYLFKAGLRYRKNVKALPGSPDIVLAKHKTVIFVNGCFWHVHECCRFFVWPSTNKIFWKNKLSKNVMRDKENYQQLISIGWKVIVVWECELKKDKPGRLDALYKEIVGSNTTEHLNNS